MNGKATLVLDLDGTLVYGRGSKRPGLYQFLERVSELYEIVVFTASNKLRADRIIDYILNSKKQYIGGDEHRFYNDSCVRGTKPLQVLQRDLRRVVAIDDDPATFACNPDNGVPIPSFSDVTLTEEERESGLLKLLPLLEQISALQDLRPAIRQWKESGFKAQQAPPIICAA